MEHYAFPNVATFIDKHNRYATWEAAARERLHQDAGHKALRATPFGTALERKRWLKKLAMHAPLRPTLRFLYHYVWKQGFRDGYRGWVLCRLLACVRVCQPGEGPRDATTDHKANTRLMTRPRLERGLVVLWTILSTSPGRAYNPSALWQEAVSPTLNLEDCPG